jgi:hypothetical protein
VAWIDEEGLFPYPLVTANFMMEARWNENGAQCLNVPRNAAITRDDVACKLPLCAGPDDDLDGHRWASYGDP